MTPPFDLLWVFYAAFAFAMACGIFCLGKIAAQTVWSRAKKVLDANPYSTEVIVPYATTFETLMIFFAVMLRSPFMLMLAAYRELRLEQWEKSPKIRDLDFYQRSGGDLLGSVSNMLSGYPERAQSFYVRERAYARAKQYWAVLNDYEAVEKTLSKGRTSTV